MSKISRRRLLRSGALFLAAPAILTRPALAAGHLKLPVEISGFAFAPNAVELGAGDYVVFTNLDNAPHTATADNGFFDTGRLNNGQSAEVRMTEPGEFTYFCNFHRNMRGTITVT